MLRDINIIFCPWFVGWAYIAVARIQRKNVVGNWQTISVVVRVIAHTPKAACIGIDRSCYFGSEIGDRFRKAGVAATFGNEFNFFKDIIGATSAKVEIEAPIIIV